MKIQEVTEDLPKIGDIMCFEFNDVAIESTIIDINESWITVKFEDCNDFIREALDVNITITQLLSEAEYQGRKVSLGKAFLTPDGPKKRSVYVKNAKGNVVKVNFGQKGVKIKKSIPARRKSFRARHNCSNPGPRWKARYWSCKFW